MDIKMPIMDGLEASTNIRMFNSNVPIIAFSCYNEAAIKPQMENSGMNSYLSKYAELKSICNAIIMHLN